MGAHGEPHPPSYYVRIWGILLVLLVISILGPELEIKILTLITAFGIAFVKAYLVCKHFMHLDVERPIVLYILSTAVVFMVLFFAGAAPDVMNHDGTNWSNNAAHAAVQRGGEGVDIRAVRSRYGGPQQCSSWLVSHRTGERYCSSPRLSVAEVRGDLALEAPELPDEPSGPDLSLVTESKDDLMQLGEHVYGSVCVACHQADGNGLPGAFPPLAGAGDFYGDPQNMAKIIVKGLSGPITVKGVDYNGVMPPQGNLSDIEIAAVATYVRNSFGNNDGLVMKADVAAVR